jgi:hypothetical protein
VREEDGGGQGQTAADGENGIADTAAVSLKATGAEGCLPLVGAAAEMGKAELQLFNTRSLIIRDKEQDKNPKTKPSMMENQEREASEGLPLVGTGALHTNRKEPLGTACLLTRFHDHLVLESKPHFMIILRLENASWTLGIDSSEL